MQNLLYEYMDEPTMLISKSLNGSDYFIEVFNFSLNSTFPSKGFTQRLAECAYIFKVLFKKINEKEISRFSVWEFVREVENRR